MFIRATHAMTRFSKYSKVSSSCMLCCSYIPLTCIAMEMPFTFSIECNTEFSKKYKHGESSKGNELQRKGAPLKYLMILLEGMSVRKYNQ